MASDGDRSLRLREGRSQLEECTPMNAIFDVSLPEWLQDHLKDNMKTYPTIEGRMRFVIGIARENVCRKTGGPFGAGVFDSQGRLIAAGVNLVESGNCSILHAEMVAIALAQKKLGRYDIGKGGKQDCELTASTEPCAMCFGAIHWSGVSRLACGARDEDARAIGFDEGPKLDTWRAALEERGIEVFQDVMRDESVDVLSLYAQSGGRIYNSKAIT